MIKYSIVVPAFNEAESLPELHASLTAALQDLGKEYEILFVNDGSFDRTEEVMRQIERSDARVHIISLLRNYGKSAAYMAAFDAVKGEIVLTLDADLQDDPAEIKNLLAKIAEGFDLVVGWKKNRFENEPQKKLPSMFFNLLFRVLFGLRLHDSNSGMRAMTVHVARNLVLYGDLYRFIPALAATRGFRVTESPVNHRRRKFDQSKYGISRFWTGLLDLVTVRFLTRFLEKPLHFFGTLGILPFLAGGGLELYVLAQKISGNTFQEHVAAIIIGVLLILVGVQLMAIGLIGEMLSAQLHRKPQHKLRKTAGEQDSEERDPMV